MGIDIYISILLRMSFWIDIIYPKCSSGISREKLSIEFSVLFLFIYRKILGVGFAATPILPEISPNPCRKIFNGLAISGFFAPNVWREDSHLVLYVLIGSRNFPIRQNISHLMQFCICFFLMMQKIFC